MSLMILSVPLQAQAESKQINITTENYNGGKAIQEALDLQSGDLPAYEQLTVYIQGGAYNITTPLLVYSNTRICAAKDTVIRYCMEEGAKENQTGRAPLLSNACSGKKGYEGASNISVEGGTWDFQGHAQGVHYGMSMEAFRFMHGRNFRFINLTMQNLYRSHFLTIEGVENVEVKGCTFRNYSNLSFKKEAIHIDCMHNDHMAPSNLENIIYDDTICNHITVTNCTFSRVPRGVGTHVAVGGLFPSDIVISNNVFSDITYEAIKAYHYKNVKITGNVITRAGCGIKYYLYSLDSDKDEESATNYLVALMRTKTESVPERQNITIQGNTIREIVNDKTGYGIQLVGNANRIISDATVADNVITISGTLPSAKRSGISVKYGKNIRLVSNRIYKTGGNGISISNGTGITVKDNSIISAAANGMAVKYSQNVYATGNTISWSGKCNLIYKATKGGKIESTNMWKDKTGGIALTAGSDDIYIIKNSITNSRKNAISISSSTQAKVKENIIKSPKKYGIYTYKADKSRIEENQIYKSKSSAVIASKGTGIVVYHNRIDKTGKYGILFMRAERCYAKDNYLTGTKKHGIIYSLNSKDRKQNLDYPYARLKKGEKEIRGYTYPKILVRAIKGTKIKSKRTAWDGKFTIKVPKMKKDQIYVIRVKDKLGNYMDMQKTVTLTKEQKKALAKKKRELEKKKREKEKERRKKEKEKEKKKKEKEKEKKKTEKKKKEKTVKK